MVLATVSDREGQRGAPRARRACRRLAGRAVGPWGLAGGVSAVIALASVPPVLAQGNPAQPAAPPSAQAPPQASSPDTPPASSPDPAAPPPPAPDPRREEARDLLRKGLALFEAGEVPRALEFFRQSMAVFPAKGNTINAANCLRDLGRLDESLALYEEAVASFSGAFDEGDRVAVPAVMAELRSKVGAVFVSANTTGSVVVEGRVRGELPLSLPIRLMPGRRVVRVIKDGYGTFEAAVEVRAGNTSRVDARLEPLAAAGGLRIEDAQLVGAEVVVDGVVVGKAPWEGTLAPGPHVVSSRAAGVGSPPTLATVLQGQTALLRLKSGRLGAERRVVIRPESAEIRLGDVPLGRGQWIGALPAGNYTVSGAEDGYFGASQPLTVAEGVGGDVVLDLAVDEAHPRWPRKPAGKVSAGVFALYGLGLGLGSGAGDSCKSGASCTSQGVASGPIGGVRGAYEFPFHLSVEVAAGFATLSQGIHRDVPRAGAVGSNDGVSYRMEDLVRLKGYVLAVGAGYGLPLGGRWALRPRVMAGVMFATSSDAITGQVATAQGEDRAGVDGAGRGVSSTPLFLMPDLGLSARLGDWEAGASLSAFVLLSQGPDLGNGAVRVFPSCNAQAPSSPGCVADSGQFRGEKAYAPFVLAAPQLTVSRVF
jgi:hypothetical protein